MVHPFLSASTTVKGGIDPELAHRRRGGFASGAFADAAVVNAVVAAAAVAAGRTIVVSYPFGRVRRGRQGRQGHRDHRGLQGRQFKGVGIAVRLS